MSGADLMEIAQQSVMRIHPLVAGTKLPMHGSAFAYKQVIKQDHSGSRLFFLTNLHNFSLALPAFSAFTRKYAGNSKFEDDFRGPETGYFLDIGGTGVRIDSIIAVKGAIFSHSGPQIQHDFAICTVETLVTTPLKLFGMPAEHVIRPGDSIYAFGYPAITDLGITDGIVSRVYDGNPTNPLFANVIQHNLLINGGNSGGPTVDQYGTAVGISTAGLSRATGINMSADVRKILDICTDSSAIEEVSLTAVLDRLLRRAVEEARYGS